MNSLLLWLKASRLPSQSYIALPLLLGQVIALQRGQWHTWSIFVLVQLFGLFDQLYIVYANDYADQETDALNDTYTPFSGGSRVLADGHIQPRHIKTAAILMAALCIAVTVVIGALSGHWLPLPLAALGLFLLHAYSYPPLRLSYRGGGEFLQMLGVGTVLPLLAFTAHTGTFVGFPWELLLFLAPTQLACGIATALPDAPSDAQSSKHTLPVRIGVPAAHGVIVALNLLGAGILALQGQALASLQVQDLQTLAGVVASPMLLGALLIPWSRPGSRVILGFVFLSILTTLLWTGGFCVLFWHAYAP